MELPVRIVGTALPGTEFDGRTGIHIALERGKERIGATPADADSVTFDFTVNVVDGDVRGAYVHGKRGERFARLTWGCPDQGEDGWQFRRTKIAFRDIDGLIAEALASGGVLEVTVELSAADGSPAAGTVRPDRLTWRVA